MLIPVLAVEVEVIVVEKVLNDGEAKKLKGNFVESRHFTRLVKSNAIVRKPNGEILFRLVKNAIPLSLCEKMHPIFRSMAKNSVAGGNRATASGVKQERRVRKNGSLSNIMVVPRNVPHLVGATDGVSGFMDSSGFARYCREINYGGKSGKLAEVLPYIQSVNVVFAEFMPTRYEAQMERVRTTKPEWIIGDTAFSTLTINRNFRTAGHKDSGDLPEGFGVITAFCAGAFEGGELIFPQYGIAVEIETGDVLLADVHEWHGNAPLVGVDGSYERISTVMYYRRKMLQCGTDEEEAVKKNR